MKKTITVAPGYARVAWGPSGIGTTTDLYIFGTAT